MPNKLDKAFEPANLEKKWYSYWMERGYFNAEEKSDKPPYCIVIPPPNITGALHMGHALTVTIQDLLVRWKRMKGYNVLWLPGTDHAGIATQMVVERQLDRQGVSRHDIGREKFLEHVWEWKNNFGSRITEQLKRVGASVDWSRERFTMDDGLSKAVRHVFVSLYDEGLLYRAQRLINWCPSCQSALSDLEVDREEPEKGEMWSFAYKLIDSDEEIVVATTRPETMLGDTAIAVHPDDERYKRLVGKHVQHPFVDRTFPIIADEVLADPELGTGAVKVTPAHDPNDFACGERNDLEFINILNPDGTLNDQCGTFAGQERFTARKNVKEALENLGLQRGEKDHFYAPGRCYRHPKTIVEPMLSTQWFVEAQPLADKALAAVKEGKTAFVPQEWEKTYYHWLENIQPWCISRQLWWGHRIPAWYCSDCNEVTVAKEDVTQCQHCSSKNVKQDEDVLDTWFSSALWPFSTLGWPEKTPLLDTFYPTSVMETGYDIIFFWVARMMMMGLHFMDDVPFDKVLLHAMVRDEHGKKMSKATGNVIDPIDVIDGITLQGLHDKLKAYNLPKKEEEKAKKAQKQQFPQGIEASGTDALRFTLAAYTAQSKDINLSLKRIEGYRKFGNKIWQATKFMLSILSEDFKAPVETPEPKTLADAWILSRLGHTIKTVDKGLENFKVFETTSVLYHFIWNELCDWYLEWIKPILYDDTGDEEQKQTAQAVVYHCIEVAMRLLHPIMPFITEELWQAIPRREGMAESIMISPYPGEQDGLFDEQAQENFDTIIQVVTAIRTIRSDYTIAPRVQLQAHVQVHDEKYQALLHSVLGTLQKISFATISIEKTGDKPKGTVVQAIPIGEVLVSLSEVIDVDAEINRMEKELDKLQKEYKRSESKLSNENFIGKAPADVVGKEKEKLAQSTAMIESLKSGLQRVKELA